ncbi:FIG139438: lipoprotein B [hydrothermal vent metagenome]|uniref:FIG139438: lipoprotein B n=1 Tax=hydrothermal vent metagenome TaxID=652676 RepID=A0A3B1C5U6_9ZZZZ
MNETTTETKKAGMLKRLYSWVLSFADSPFGTPALFIFAMVESSFFPIPPDPLLVAMGLGAPARAIWFATVCTTGSVIGGALGYAIGFYFIDSVGMKIIEIYGLSGKYDDIRVLYEEWNALIVLVAGLSPIPYKVFTIAAGAFKVNFFTFVIASIVGRGLRFYIEGFMIYHYGPPIRSFIDANITKLSWAFAFLLVLGFVAIKVFAG